jgi:hypothetical protein
LDAGWNSFATAVRDRLFANLADGLSSDEAEALLIAAIDINGSVTNMRLLRQLVTEGHIAHLLTTSAATKSVTVQALCLMIWALVDPGMSAPAGMGRSKAGLDALNQFAVSAPAGLAGRLTTLLEQYDKAALVVVLLDRSPSLQELAGHVLAQLVAEHGHTELLTEDLLWRHWRVVADHLDENSIGAAMRAAPALVATVTESSFETGMLDLYASIAQAFPESRPLREWLIHESEAVPQEVWTEAIEGNGELFSFIVNIRRDGLPVDPGLGLRDALREYAQKLLDGTDVAHSDQAWDERINLLKDSQVAALAADVYHALRADPGRINEGFLRVFGGLLDKEGSVREDREAPTMLVEPWVESPSIVGLDWVLGLLRKDGKLFGRAKPRIVTALKERVDHALAKTESEDQDEEQAARFREVLRQLAAELANIVR